jgi:choline dehydrogenase
MTIAKRSYDYIVVGAGTAGCLIAGTLAANRCRVLLIEAGQHPTHLANEKLCEWPQWLGCSLDYAYPTSSRAIADSVVWNRGRVVGGSGVVNGSLYLRGCDADYRNWASLAADDTWAPASVHAIFDTLEHRSQLALPVRKISVQSQDPLSEWSISFYESCRRYGIKVGSADPAIVRGVCYYKVSAFQHRRSSTYASHLMPVLAQENLRLLESTVAEKIIFSGRRAVGVAVTGLDGKALFEAAGEVILCGGAVETPRLLLKSGIGPRPKLDELGLSCVIDNRNVGRHLVDHPRVAIRLPAKGSFSPLSAASTGTEVGLFLDAREQTTADSAPEVQCFVLPPKFSANGPVECALSFTLTHPRSTGSIQLKTTPDETLIDSGYLTVDGDLATLTAALRQLHDLLRGCASSLALIPEWESKIPDKDSVAQFIRSNVQTAWHHSCSARMATSEEQGVVDRDYRVFSSECLRIGDTSAFPDIPTANTNAPAMMFAQRLANILG